MNKKVWQILTRVVVGSVMNLMLVSVASCGSEGNLAIATQPAAAVATPQGTVVNTSSAPDFSPTRVATTAITVSSTLTDPSDSQVVVGQAFNRPYTQPLRIKVVKTADPPSISLETATQVVYNNHSKLPYLLGTPSVGRSGKMVTLSATYGLVTWGENTPNGWAGNVNIPIANCTVDGKCKSTGVVLNHLENVSSQNFGV